VNVIFDASDGEGLHITLAGDAAEVGPKPHWKVGVDLFAALLRGEDDVVEGADVRVRHGKFPEMTSGAAAQQRPGGTP
jgi:hypothetical protein